MQTSGKPKYKQAQSTSNKKRRPGQIKLRKKGSFLLIARTRWLGFYLVQANKIAALCKSENVQDGQFNIEVCASRFWLYKWIQAASANKIIGVGLDKPSAAKRIPLGYAALWPDALGVPGPGVPSHPPGSIQVTYLPQVTRC